MMEAIWRLSIGRSRQSACLLGRAAYRIFLEPSRKNFEVNWSGRKIPSGKRTAASQERPLWILRLAGRILLRSAARRRCALSRVHRARDSAPKPCPHQHPFESHTAPTRRAVERAPRNLALVQGQVLGKVALRQGQVPSSVALSQGQVLRAPSEVDGQDLIGLSVRRLMIVESNEARVLFHQRAIRVGPRSPSAHSQV